MNQEQELQLSNLSPAQKRNVVKIALEKFERLDNLHIQGNLSDFDNQRDVYIELNTALQFVTEHNPQIAIEYRKNSQKMEQIYEEQDKRASFIKNEDTGKTEMIPHKDDEKYVKFFEENNYKLAKELDKQLNMMENEAKLYEKTKNADNEKLKEISAKLKDGVLKYSPNEEIDKERFKQSYPIATKRIEKAFQNQIEAKKEQGMQI